MPESFAADFFVMRAPLLPLESPLRMRMPLRMAPPMTLTQEEADQGLALLLEALYDVQHATHGIAKPVEVTA